MNLRFRAYETREDGRTPLLCYCLVAYAWIRTKDLELMRLASCQTAPRRNKTGAPCLIRTDDLPLTRRVPSATGLRGQNLKILWWRISDSNRSPQACKASALPDELIPHETCWHLRQESNPYILVRTEAFYPLNYGDNLSKSSFRTF